MFCRVVMHSSHVTNMRTHKLETFHKGSSKLAPHALFGYDYKHLGILKKHSSLNNALSGVNHSLYTWHILQLRMIVSI